MRAVIPLLVHSAVLLKPAVAACYWPESLDAVFADMHDGDKKHVSIKGNSMVIKPSGNNQTWTITAVLDTSTCGAVVDFNVPGKPNPPPVNLTLSLWSALTPAGRSAVSKATFEFFDPSGKLGPKDLPLNAWVQLGTNSDRPGAGCPDNFKAVFADMHDGDKKQVEIKGSDMVITPSGNDEQWTVKAKIDKGTCVALVDFNVKGKPNPPPVKLDLSLWNLFSGVGGFSQKVEFEFTDPSGKLAKSDFPLNTWVQLGKSPTILM
jgi:hypothetical protein